jgi:hypothetical protein
MKVSGSQNETGTDAAFNLDQKLSLELESTEKGYICSMFPFGCSFFQDSQA